MKGISKFFSEHSSLVLSLVTSALVIVTFFYLIETRLIRKVTEQYFTIETSPKIFLQDIDFKLRPNDSNREIEVRAVFKVKNAGKTQGDDFKATYIFSLGNIIKKEGKIEAPYLFPGQIVQYETKMLGVSFSEEDFAIAKKDLEKTFALYLSPEVAPFFLDLNLRYIDQNEEEQNVPYKIKYTLYSNTWNFITEEEK